METAVLGRTGIRVSRLCFGSLPFSPLQRDCDPEEAGALLAEAFALGVNFVDTAQLYRNYAHIRAGLSRAKGPVAVASKTYAHTGALCRAAVEETRRGLDRDVIDIFLLHEQESEHTLRGHAAALEYLYACKARGTVRAVGLSTHQAAGVDAAVSAGLDIVHPLLNFKGMGLRGGLADMEKAILRAGAAGLGVYTMKALGGGALYKDAAAALTYALRWGGSTALGIRCREELLDDVYFFTHGRFPDRPAAAPGAARRLWIAGWCTGCGLCAGHCPSGALSISNDRAMCDRTRCVLCGYCAGHCPDLCVKLI